MVDNEFTGNKKFFQEVEDMRQELSELEYRREEGDELNQDEISRLCDWKYDLMK
jgi:hypothetical protein